jgi:hypothetical protein
MPHQTQSPRLDQLLTLLSCPRDIAPIDAHSFARRTGELISRSANARWRTPKASHLRIAHTEAPQRFWQQRRHGKR